MIETARLILRRWRDEDCDAYAAINADAEVMALQGGPMTREITETVIDRYNDSIAAIGYGRWAVERRSDGAMIGHCGMMPAFPNTSIAGLPEIGWRLGRAVWGAGYATEAARAAIAEGFERLHLPAIFAYTVASNTRSLAVIARLGMARDEARDYDNPHLALDDPTRRKLMFRADRP